MTSAAQEFAAPHHLGTNGLEPDLPGIPPEDARFGWETAYNRLQQRAHTAHALRGCR